VLDINLLVESDGLYMTTLPEGQSFVWRLLTLKEYRVFSSLRQNGVLSTMQLHVEVFNRCYIGEPRAINGRLRAGIFLSIGELIMYLSGDCAGQEAQEIDQARTQYHQAGVLEVMQRVILMAFPYKPEELLGWTRAKVTRTFVMAEALLQNKSEYTPLDTSKIMSQSDMSKQGKKPVVDMRRENRELGKEMGDRQHALDLHPAKLAEKARKTQGLIAEQLRSLDKSQEHEKRVKHRRS
jgi:hypothetical protein